MAQQGKSGAFTSGVVASWWRGLAPPLRASGIAAIAGFVALAMLLGETPSARGTWMAAIAQPVRLLCGWGAPLVLLGTIALAILVIAAAVRRAPLPRPRVVIGGGLALWLLLIESQLIRHGLTGGILGRLGGALLAHLPTTTQHILMIGGLGIAGLIAFRVSWRDVARITRPAPPTPIKAIARQPAPLRAADLVSPFPVTEPTGAPLSTMWQHPPTAPPLTTTPPPLPALAPTAAALGVGYPPLAGVAMRQPEQVQPTYATTDSSISTAALRVPAYLRREAPPRPASYALPPLTSGSATNDLQGRATEPPPSPFHSPPSGARPPADAALTRPVTTLPISATPLPVSKSDAPATPYRITPTPPRPTPASSVGEHHKTTVRAVDGHWELPALSILHTAPLTDEADAQAYATKQAALIARTLRDFGVDAEVRASDISIGPTLIRFGIRPLEKLRIDDRGHAIRDAHGDPLAQRTSVKRILQLRQDLALALAVPTLRMEAPVPAQPYVGIEIPNTQGRVVTLHEVLTSDAWQAASQGARAENMDLGATYSSTLPHGPDAIAHEPARDGQRAVAETPRAARTHPADLLIGLGRDSVGRVRVADLAQFPHVLIAGATGTGKSVCLNAILASMLARATPDQVRCLLIDPKMVELTPYADIPHLLAPVITDLQLAEQALAEVTAEMERRYRIFARAGVRHLSAYAELRAGSPGVAADQSMLPRILVVIDELADLMLIGGVRVERQIARLAQLARATGIHLVLATQRPTVDVITGLIKANIPTRIAFKVAAAVDSRTILDRGGAELLLGKGDMLLLSSDNPQPERIQGTFVDDDEVRQLANHWRAQARIVGQPDQWDLEAQRQVAG